MAWTSGTASNLVDLLQALETFLSANGWTVLRSETFQNADGDVIDQATRGSGERWSTTADGDVDEYRLVVEGPGYTGSQPPVFGIETRRWATEGLYYLVNCAAVGDNGSGHVYHLPGVSDDPYAFATFMAWDSSMPYWFTEDGGAVCAVVQVSNRFLHFYMGHYIPFSSPGEVPQPAIYTGNCNQDILWPYSDNANISCVGTYRNQINAHVWVGGNVALRPYTYLSTGSIADESFYYTTDLPTFLPGVMPNGDSVVVPITLINNLYGCLGELSLIYKILPDQVSPGSTVTISGVDYLITNNGPYSGDRDYFAVRLG